VSPSIQNPAGPHTAVNGGFARRVGVEADAHVLHLRKRKYISLLPNERKGVAGEAAAWFSRQMSHHTLKLVTRTGLGAFERHVFQKVRRATVKGEDDEKTKKKGWSNGLEIDLSTSTSLTRCCRQFQSGCQRQCAPQQSPFGAETVKVKSRSGSGVGIRTAGEGTLSRVLCALQRSLLAGARTDSVTTRKPLARVVTCASGTMLSETAAAADA
jgi:hypothetical protein